MRHTSHLAVLVEVLRRQPGINKANTASPDAVDYVHSSSMQGP